MTQPTAADTNAIRQRLEKITGKPEWEIFNQDRAAFNEHAPADIAALLGMVERLTKELADTKDDYLRVHKDSVDRYEQIIALQAEALALREGLKYVADNLGVAIHTSLRRVGNTDAQHKVWLGIREMPDKDWADVIGQAIYDLGINQLLEPKQP